MSKKCFDCEAETYKDSALCIECHGKNKEAIPTSVGAQCEKCGRWLVWERLHHSPGCDCDEGFDCFWICDACSPGQKEGRK